jgi:DNA-binding MarR family transcriptional regulator
VAARPLTPREQSFALTRLIDKPFDLYRHVPFRLATITNLLALDRDGAIREVSSLGLRELRLLLNVGSYMPIRISDVAYQTRLDSYTVSRAAKTLLRHQLIELQADPSDRRVQWAKLTESGVREYRRIVKIVEARGQVLESVLSPAEVENLRGILTRLEEQAEALLAAHALALLRKGRRLPADQRELMRWHKRATAHRRGPPVGRPGC